MAIVNTKSTVITNADTEGGTINGSYLAKGAVYSACGTVEVAAADDDTSVFRFCRVPSNARIISIKIFNDAITGATAYHCGLHQTAANGGAAADADVYATSVDINAGLNGTELVREALNIDKVEKRVWENLALSSDPKRDYDITMTGATVGSAAGTITLEVLYTV
jgi:hypothetical protein